VVGYKVFTSTDGTNYALCSTLNATSYSNNGLSANTPYWYKVSAYDAVGNISDYSNVVTGTTPAVADTTPPSVPSALTATVVSSGQINLTWNPSTDTGGSGLAGYKLYRSTDGSNFQLLTSILSTSYSDSGLSASTLYYYKVSAYDGAGNTSAQSSAATATTQSAATGNQLVAHWKFDETTGTLATDASGNANNGTVYGATWSGGALSLNGTVNNYVARNPFNMPANELTISFWMKTSDTTNEGVPVSYASSTADNTFSVFNYKNLTIVKEGGTTPTHAYTGVSANDGNWHHIVVTHKTSDGETKLYKDGILVYTGTNAPSTSIAQNGYLVLGQDQDTIGGGFETIQSFLGLLDDVKIYNYARSATDILAEYNAFYKPIQTVSFGSYLRGVTYDPIYNKVYVASWPDGASWVYAVSATNYTLETTITSQNDNHGAVVVSPDGRYIYTGNYYGGSVTRFDRNNSYAKTTLSLGSWANALILSPDGSKLYVVLGTDGRTNEDTGSKIAVVDTATFTLVEYINLPEATYGESGGLVLSPDGTKLYVSAGQSGGSNNWRPRVHTVSLTSKTVVASKEGYSGGKDGMDITPDGQFLYLCDFPNNKINILSTSDLGFQYSISVGSSPRGIAISPDGNTVLVSNRTDNTISQIDVNSRTVVKVIPAGELNSPNAITFNSTGTFAYVLNDENPGKLLVLGRGQWQLNTPFNPASQDQVVATVNGIHGAEDQSQAVESFNGKIYYSVRGDGTSTPWKVYCYNPVNNENSTVISSTSDSIWTALKSMKGNLYISHTNGKLWKYDGSSVTEVTGTPFTSTTYVNAMCEFNNKMYFGTYGGNIYESSDGISFTLRYTITAGRPIFDLVVWKGYLYGCNFEGYAYSSKIVRSTDGINWSVMGSFNCFALAGFVATPDYLYVASTESASGPSFAIRSSADGVTWNRFFYTTSEGKVLDGRPCYFTQTGRAYFLTGWNSSVLCPCYNGSIEARITLSHGYVSLVELNGRLFGIGSQSASGSPNVTSPTVISILGNYSQQ
jgi:YVTN family beta-propeller protein